MGRFDLKNFTIDNPLPMTSLSFGPGIQYYIKFKEGVAIDPDKIIIVSNKGMKPVSLFDDRKWKDATVMIGNGLASWESILIPVDDKIRGKSHVEIYKYFEEKYPEQNKRND